MLTYRSGSSKKEIILSGDKIKSRIKTAGFHEYEWEVEAVERVIGSWVNGFRKKAKQYNLEIDFVGNRQERAESMNAFYEITEKDVLELKPGRLILDEYYIECFVIGAEVGKLDNQSRKVQRKAKIYAPYPFWIHKKTYKFKKGNIGNQTESFLDYPYNYEYDYMGNIKGVGRIENTEIASCNFEAIIYGPVTNPRFIINEHVYEVKTKLDEGDYLVINSADGEVVRMRKNGLQVNEFNNRNKSSSIFEKIAPGSNLVSWNGEFGMDISVLAERGEPICK
jgi:hypothetical protein